MAIDWKVRRGGSDCSSGFDMMQNSQVKYIECKEVMENIVGL